MGETEVLSPRESTDLIPLAPADPNLNVNKFEAVIRLAEQVDKIAGALDKVRKLVLSRCLPGDWVRFGDKIECSAAAAERMRTIVGLCFTHWTSWREDWEDNNGKGFTWWYRANVELNGQTIFEYIENRQSSRDKFFGYENGKWKELSDVKESDIRMAARRGVIKEGVKVFLGLRSLPNDDVALRSLGLDPSKIKKVEYGQKGETKVAGAAPGTPVLIKEINPFTGTAKATGKPYTRYDIVDDSGAKHSTFDKKIADYAQKLKDDGQKVIFDDEITPKGNTIKELRPAEDKKKEPDQEPEA